ncbi:MAG: hypothetical protein ABIH23_32730 [bacterium]
MPHIQICGEISLERVWQTFERFKALDPCPISVDAPYMRRNGNELLFRATVVEDGRGQKFYVVAASKPEGCMLRIDPLADPVKTDGVKRVLALLAERIRAIFPESTYGVTNLGEFLKPEGS